MSLSIARRYAGAFADILFATGVPAAQQHTEVQNAKQQLASFATLLTQHTPLRNVLANPAVPREQKRAVLDHLRRPLGLSQLARNFLAVLLDHRRLDLLEAVLAAFDHEVYARLGIVPVEVTTAFTLSERHKKLLEQRLAALTGSTVEMRFRENPEILAGVVARLGSTIYDASLRSQLRRLQQHLTAEPR